MNELKIEILPEAAKRELASFYEYLVFKYLKGMETAEEANNGRNKNLAAFSEFKNFRDRIYIRTKKYKDGINASFGAWKGDDHPELKNGTDSFIRDIRKSGSKI